MKGIDDYVTDGFLEDGAFAQDQSCVRATVIFKLLMLLGRRGLGLLKNGFDQFIDIDG